MREIVYTVKEGATLTCSLGYEESNLKVPQDHSVSAQSGNAAIISDSIPYTNIPPFCKCLRAVPGVQPLYPEKPVVECTPEVVLHWLNGRKEYTIDDELALLNICIVPCIYGGIIKIKQSGQKQ